MLLEVHLCSKHSIGREGVNPIKNYNITFYKCCRSSCRPRTPRPSALRQDTYKTLKRTLFSLFFPLLLMATRSGQGQEQIDRDGEEAVRHDNRGRKRELCQELNVDTRDLFNTSGVLRRH